MKTQMTPAGVSDDTMHMMAGMFVLTVAAMLLRRPPWGLWPWLVAVIAETVNEAYDLTHGADEGNWPDSWHDFWITLLWPTIVLLVWRRLDRRPASGSGGPPSRDEVEQPLE